MVTLNYCSFYVLSNVQYNIAYHSLASNISLSLMVDCYPNRYDTFSNVFIILTTARTIILMSLCIPREVCNFRLQGYKTRFGQKNVGTLIDGVRVCVCHISKVLLIFAVSNFKKHLLIEGFYRYKPK